MQTEMTAPPVPAGAAQNMRTAPEAVALAIVTRVAGLSRVPFFEGLARGLVVELGCRWAYVGETVPGDHSRVQTLAVCGRQGLVENINYSLVGTPCGAVVGWEVCHYPRGVRELFPASSLSREFEVESYLGLPLFDADGKSIGLLVMLHDGPMDESGIAGSVNAAAARAALMLVADRTAAELQRLRAERAVIDAQTRLDICMGERCPQAVSAAMLAHGIERRKAANQDQLRATVVDQINDAVVGFGFDARVTFWNAAAEKRYGFTAADAVGRLNREVLDYDYLDGTTDEQVVQALRRGEPWVREMRHTTKTGRSFDVLVSLTLHKDEGGTPIGVLAVFQDITELKAAHDAAANTRRLFDCFMAYSPAMAYMKDEAGRFVYVNAAMMKQSGLTREQLIGKAGHELWPGINADHFRRDDIAVWHAEKPIKLQYSTHIEPFGLRHWMTHKFPVRGTAGERLIGGLTVDVTEQIKAQDQLRDRERTYREASETSRRLLTELDHRVRNNLANLTGLLGLMRERTDDVQVFAAALDARLHAMAHVHRLMAGTGYQAVALREFAESLLQVARGICNQPLTVAVDGPAVRVEAEQVLPLTMILVEWFTNSCKYGAGTVAGGQVDLFWREARDDRHGSKVHLHWREMGGPLIREPVVPSLGTSLVRSFATRELHGTCELRYPPTGVDHEIVFPINPRISNGETAAQSAVKAG